MTSKKNAEFVRYSISSRLHRWGDVTRSYSFSMVLLLIALIAMQGCETGSPVPEKSIVVTQLEKLLKKKQWVVESVTVNDKPHPEYEKFTISFSGTPGQSTFQYAVSNVPKLSPWPSQGTFYFSEDQPTLQLIRDKEDADKRLSVNYALSDDKLRIVFEFSGIGYENKFVLGTTRVEVGNWKFNFK